MKEKEIYYLDIFEKSSAPFGRIVYDPTEENLRVEIADTASDVLKRRIVFTLNNIISRGEFAVEFSEGELAISHAPDLLYRALVEELRLLGMVVRDAQDATA